MNRYHKNNTSCCCLNIIFGGLLITIIIAYLIFPLQTNLLVLGIDYTPPNSFLGRTDTIILTTLQPYKGYIGMLSIPRDLWVNIPNVGENRINTAHFFAESTLPGSGGHTAKLTIKNNFGINIDYYIRIRFDGFKEIIDSMGGVTITLTEPTAGYPVGIHHLNGNKALAFVRNRMGADDFFRMQHGQLLLKSVLIQLMKPTTIPKYPGIFVSSLKSIDTDIPIWNIPRLGIILIFSNIWGIDNHTITRDLVTPYTTSQGANVLLPNWALINQVVEQIFLR